MRRWIAFPLSAVVAVAVGAVLFTTANHGRIEAGSFTGIELAIDCDPGTAGIQATCPAAAGSETVDVVVTNTTGADTTVGSFEFSIIGSATAPLTVPSPPTTTTTGPPGSFNCGFSPPVADDDPDPNATRSFLQCFGFATSFPLLAGSSLVLASVTYTAPASGFTVTIANGVVGDVVGIELLSCNPVITNAGECFPATFGTTAVPTATATPTPTVTNTATPINTTPTPCPDGICPTATPLDFVTVTPTPCDPNCPADTATPGTGDGAGAAGYSWGGIAVMTLLALGAGGLAGGSYLLAASRARKG
jgi:hypothetical protein